jgi:hypothetical protein
MHLLNAIQCNKYCDHLALSFKKSFKIVSANGRFYLIAILMPLQKDNNSYQHFINQILFHVAVGATVSLTDLDHCY